MNRYDARVGRDPESLWDTLARSAVDTADMLTGGLASHFSEGAAHRSLGAHDHEAHLRVERAMARVVTDAARTVGEGCDRVAESEGRVLRPMGVADSFYMAGVDRAVRAGITPVVDLPPAGASAPTVRVRVGDLADAAETAVRDVTRRTMREAIAAVRAARGRLDGIGRFVDGAEARPLGSGAPGAVAAVARKVILLGLAGSFAVAVAPHQAQAQAQAQGFGLRGGQAQRAAGGQVAAQFPRPVMVRPSVAPQVTQRVQRDVTVTAPANAGGGWNGANGYGGNGYRRPDAGRIAAAVAVGAVAGAALGNGINGGYGAYGNGNYANGVYGNGGYLPYGPAGRGYVASQPPGDEIVLAAKLVAMERTGSIRTAEAEVNAIVAQGVACARQGADGCVANAPGMHFDFRQGVYGVSRAGHDVAVQSQGRYVEIDHAFIREALDRGMEIKRREDAGPRTGAYPGRAPTEGYWDYDRNGNLRQHVGAVTQPGHAATEGTWSYDEDQGDWEQHLPAPGR